MTVTNVLVSILAGLIAGGLMAWVSIHWIIEPSLRKWLD